MKRRDYTSTFRFSELATQAESGTCRVTVALDKVIFRKKNVKKKKKIIQRLTRVFLERKYLRSCFLSMKLFINSDVLGDTLLYHTEPMPDHGPWSIFHVRFLSTYIEMKEKLICVLKGDLTEPGAAP